MAARRCARTARPAGRTTSLTPPPTPRPRSPRPRGQARGGRAGGRGGSFRGVTDGGAGLGLASGYAGTGTPSGGGPANAVRQTQTTTTAPGLAEARRIVLNIRHGYLCQQAAAAV